ncbi:MAG: dienelactone hydrolase family protein [Spirochaetia bacterium]|nr:dienelactone hydrolase family protein [Spirochaetia bacterium]
MLASVLASNGINTVKVEAAASPFNQLLAAEVSKGLMAAKSSFDIEVEHVPIEVDGISRVRMAKKGNAGDKVLFGFHGNGGHKLDLLSYSMHFVEKGFVVYLLDIIVYGEHSRLRALPRTTYLEQAGADLINFIEITDACGKTVKLLDTFLNRPEFESSKIGVYGFSMGGVMSVRSLIGCRKIATACPMMGTGQLGQLGADATLFGKINTFLKESDPFADIPKLAAKPMLVQFGQKDPFVPVEAVKSMMEASQAAYEKTGVPFELRFLPDVGHSVVPELFDNAGVWFQRFLG